MEKEMAINGSKVTYFDDGEGFPFLIIHGWGPWLSYPPYGKLRELLVSCGYRVIFLILPGFGESSFPSPKWGMDDYLKCILSFIDRLGLEKFFLFGHSMGGAMSVKLAVSYPEKIKALILLSPGVFLSWQSSAWGRRIIASGFYGFFMVVKTGEIFLSFCLALLKSLLVFCSKAIKSKKIRNRLEAKFEKSLKKIIKWWDRWNPMNQFFLSRKKMMGEILKNIIRTENTIPYLQKISHPTLVIYGGWNDIPTFYLCAPHMGHIPNYTFKIIPGAGHNSQEKVPEKVVELIKDFIKELEDKEKVTPKE